MYCGSLFHKCKSRAQVSFHRFNLYLSLFINTGLFFKNEGLFFTNREFFLRVCPGGVLYALGALDEDANVAGVCRKSLWGGYD